MQKKNKKKAKPRSKKKGTWTRTSWTTRILMGGLHSAWLTSKPTLKPYPAKAAGNRRSPRIPRICPLLFQFFLCFYFWFLFFAFFFGFCFLHPSFLLLFLLFDFPFFFLFFCFLFFSVLRFCFLFFHFFPFFFCFFFKFKKY